MYKLVILIEPPQDPELFDSVWPRFLYTAEKMPGLRREATSRIDKTLFGDTQFSQIHELFFDSQKDAEHAMGSKQGQAAGKVLQSITGGRMVLFLADHKEDDIANILKFRQGGVEPD